jgi:hypothetical protein
LAPYFSLWAGGGIAAARRFIGFIKSLDPSVAKQGPRLTLT